MRADRDLLEFAARAAGIAGKWIDDLGFIRIEPDGTRGAWWSPLDDDGDALRLAVKLRMDIVCMPWRAEAAVEQFSAVEPIINSNHYAATRRAIVRAAAAVGEQMQEQSR